MGTVNLYNYDNNYALEAVPCAYGSSYQALIAIENKTFYVNGVQFTLTVNTSGTRKQITISGNAYFADDGYYTYRSILEAAGLQFIEGEYQANFLNWTEPPCSIRYGASDDAITYPMFQFKQEAFIGTRYTLSAGFGASSTSFVNYGLGEIGYSPMRQFSIGSIVAFDTKSTEYGGYVFGMIGVNAQFSINAGTGSTTIYVGWDTNINPNTLNGSGWDPSEGQKGFKPIGDRVKEKVIGGGGSGQSGHTPKYQTDNIAQPGAPDESAASAANLGFINVYKVDATNLNKVGQMLYNPVFRVLFGGFSDPIDGIISLNIFPCSPDVGIASTIGALGYSLASTALGVTAQGNKITHQFKTFDFGSVTISEEWESFLDYDATSVTLFLPFIGEVELPADEVMNASVNVQYTIDFFTGMCVANVLITKNVFLVSNRTVSHKTQHSYQGNCAINLPLTAVNYGSMIGSFVNAASSGLRTGLAGAATALASDALSGNFKPTITTKGTLSANAGYCGILYPYIIVTRPITTEPDSYQEVVGYPSYIATTIGACDGLCVCEDIELEGLNGATASELARIKQLCKEGVRN